MAHLKVVSAGAMVSPPTSQSQVLADVLTPLQQLQPCSPCLQENADQADRVGAPGQTGVPGRAERQLNVPEMPQEFLQHHHQGHPCEQMVIWCGYEPGAEPTELIPGRQKHMSCRGSVHFARWLFAQARGQITPFSVLVVTWRDAKACLAAIRAAQTGNDADLRLDSKRPPLSQLIGHMAAGSPRLAVARVIVAVDSAKMHALAAHLIKQRQASVEGIRLQVCQVPLKPERAQPAQLEWQRPAWLRSPISGLSTASSSSSASPRQRGADFPRRISEASSWNSAPSTDLFFGFRVRRLDL
mmetsp:Transcript_152123/g.369452  ORF Transcript_152123/g.369452 Transcript_152123/m.369452 type:complete len:299 (+) Transcript_152123:59-955(+)